MIDILALSAAAAGSIGSPTEIWDHIVSDFSNIGQPAQMAA
jgi:hypothetical protein